MTNVSNRMSLRISLNVKDNTWKPGSPLINDPKYHLNHLPTEDKMRILNNFSKFLAKRMVMLLKKRVRTQYSYLRWAPLSPGYLEFKKKVGLSENIWEATGYLVDHIYYYRKDNYYYVGISPNLKYPNSNVSVLFVAKCMEFGTRYMPARPLFGPTVNFMRRHVRKYWELFLHESLKGGLK